MKNYLIQKSEINLSRLKLNRIFRKIVQNILGKKLKIAH